MTPMLAARAGRSRVAAITALAVLLLAARADAHAVGISRGEYRPHGREVAVLLLFARPEISAAVPTIDRTTIDQAIVQRLTIATSAHHCRAQLDDLAPTEDDGLAIRATYHCFDSGPVTVT